MIRVLPRGSARQAALVHRADATASAADRAIAAVWRRLLAVLREEKNGWTARQRAAAILRGLQAALRRATERGLAKAAVSAWEGAVHELRQLPLRYLRRAAGHAPLREAAELNVGGLRDTIRRAQEGDREAFVSLLFPAPSEGLIHQLLNRGPEPWWMQLDRATRLASPDLLATIISTGYSQGKTQRQIMRDLLPAVNGVRASARRIARTEGVRLGHALQMHAHDQLGDLVIGYTIHCVHGNPNSRPWHVARDGRQYFREPAHGQLGYDRMPLPPEESPDLRDRPPKAPRTAFNCLCYLAPILRDL